MGKYDPDTVTVPGVGPVKTQSTDNIGDGFWTHQFQGSVAWDPMDNRGTAVIGTLTYETNGQEEGLQRHARRQPHVQLGHQSGPAVEE